MDFFSGPRASRTLMLKGRRSTLVPRRASPSLPLATMTSSPTATVERPMWDEGQGMGAAGCQAPRPVALRTQVVACATSADAWHCALLSTRGKTAGGWPGQHKGDSTSLQLGCAARARSRTNVHASRPSREMITRPKSSQNEWETTEI